MALDMATERRSRRSTLLPLVVMLVMVVAVIGVLRLLDTGELGDTIDRARSRPDQVVVAILAFGVAFALRALAWCRVLPGLGFWHALAGIHLSLGANHVLPLRLGEPLRAVSVIRRAGVAPDAAAASTLTLRSADLGGLVVVGSMASPSVFLDLVGRAGWVVVLPIGAVVVALIAGRWWLGRLVVGRDDVRRPGAVALGLSLVAWLAEAVLVHQAAGWAGLRLGWSEAVVVACVAVAAQALAVAPGGFGTYEAAAVAAYAALGHDADQALVAALAAHGLKTAYSVVVGLVALMVPAPSLLGRFRLQRGRAPGGAVPVPAGDRVEGPVVLFLPAHNEEAAVSEVIARVPEQVAGHRVEVVVIDDGSSDATANRAAAAGADVVSLPANRGLGAAVRAGLAEVTARGAAAGAFCDADGEYPPEELAELITPILEGRADYVVGSRFAGRIDHMLPHRRLGNQVLTRALAFMARQPITDGQTGYRALSPQAAAEAEIIHDYNYAQVLTLDLLAKGFRYLEVPISYHFRTTGRSFVRLGPYLRRVVPAIHRQLNGDLAGRPSPDEPLPAGPGGPSAW
jgi:uncharacterized membrane protein YbhN (UPF0104 family)